MANTHLHNPVYHALTSRDALLGLGEGMVRYFQPEISPFAGFDHAYANGFSDLYEQLPAGRKIIYANPEKISEPEGWKTLVHMEGLQFIYNGKPAPLDKSIHLVPLKAEHVEEMKALAELTKPGPFYARTIEFGHYYGVFAAGKLVAMTGQRMHVYDYSEISAVCTHPDFLGKGYAAALMQHQLHLILEQGQTPFLHVRADNERAIALYGRLGFTVSRPMNFYFMKKTGENSPVD